MLLLLQTKMGFYNFCSYIGMALYVLISWFFQFLSSFQCKGSEDDCTAKHFPSTRFIWRIHNFSKLIAIKGIEGVHSDTFVVAGCRWRAVIYPKENYYPGYLMLFLRCEENDRGNLLPYVKFSLTVVNQKDPMRTKRHDFIEPDEGYLTNDSCTIGIKIRVACSRVMENSNVGRNSLLFKSTGDQSLVELPPASNHTWVIKNFSERETKMHYSKAILAGGCRWFLSIDLVGDEDNSDGYLSLYVMCHEDDFINMPYIRCRFSMVDQLRGNGTFRKDLEGQLDLQHNTWRIPNFMHITEFKNPDGGYLLNDTCIIEFKIAAACTSGMMYSTDSSDDY